MQPLDKLLRRFNKKPKLEEETGVSTSLINSYLEDEVDRTDDIEIKDYRKMRNNDGTIRALYSVITMPILSTGYSFHSENENDPVREFVEESLTAPQHAGGMTTPFGLVLRNMLRAVEDGFETFEKVYTLNQDGKVIYRKIAHRDPVDITLLTDENGGLKGARQEVYANKRYVDVVIPAERLFLFTVNKEIDPLYGESFYKAARYHYDKKHRFYVIEELQAQAAAIPPRKLKVPANVDAAKLSIAERAADKFGIRQRITLPEGYDLEEYNTNPHDVQKTIQHHDQLMARSLLAQHITLTDGSGSYALSRDQSDFFLMSLESLMTDIEDHVNSWLIPDLVYYNFNNVDLPEFRMNKLSDRTKDIITSAFEEITKKGNLPQYMLDGIVSDVAQELDIEVPEVVEPVAPKQLAATDNIEVEDLNRRLDLFEQGFKDQAKQILDDIRTETFAEVKDIKKLSELKNFKISGIDAYEKLILDTYNATYLMAKNNAADELQARSPATPKETKDFFKLEAKAIAEKTAEELLFIVKSEIAKESRRKELSVDLGIADALSRIATAFSLFEDNKLELAAATVVSTSLNYARSDVFSANEDAIDRYEYSAILDSRTSPLCQDLDGSVVTPEEYAATDWKPPVHFRCRSVWVAIRKSDSFKPAFRPIPVSPGGVSNPLLSVDVESVSAELDTWIDEVTALQANLKKNEIDSDKLKELESKLEQIGV